MLLLILLFCIVITMAMCVSKIKFGLNLTNKDILIRLGSIIVCCGVCFFVLNHYTWNYHCEVQALRDLS